MITERHFDVLHFWLAAFILFYWKFIFDRQRCHKTDSLIPLSPPTDHNSNNLSVTRSPTPIILVAVPSFLEKKEIAGLKFSFYNRSVISGWHALSEPDECAIYYVYISRLLLGWPKNLSAVFIKWRTRQASERKGHQSFLTKQST